MYRTLRFAAAATVVSCFLFAQTPTGILDGRVNDASGAVVAGASVSIENQETGVHQEMTTNADGRFYQGFVLPGVYKVTVDKPGFQKYVQSEIRINVQQTVTLEVSMRVGDVASTVEITASSTQLSTESSSVSKVIGTKQIIDLPLNGRNPFSLASLAPGVVPGGGGSTPFISGGRNATNEITIDGTSVILPENNVSNLQTGYTPIVDSVLEFAVITNSLEAQYGRTGGGVISVATRGGTNQYHVSAYDFLRNSKLDANTWSNNRNGVKLAAFQQNQFGGTVGGPLSIPKIYNGANKTFFFFSEQTQRARRGTSSQASVPTDAWINGDFSGLKNGNGQPVVIYDPFTLDASGNRLPFPNNIIPANRIDKVAQNLLKYFPKPNAVPTNAFTMQNNFFVSGKGVGDDDKFDSRIDQNFSDKFRLFARGSYDHGESVPFNGFGNIGTSIGDGRNVSDLYNVTVNGVYTLSPTTILNFNYGFARNVGIRYPFSEGTTPASLGFPQSYSDVVGLSNYEFPNISFAGNTNLSNLGQATFTTLLNRPMSHIIRGDVTKVLAKHTLRAGGEWRKFFLNFTQLGNPAGAYSFGAGFTQRVVNASAVAAEGNGFATFLLGLPNNGGSVSHSFDAATASAYAGAYVQDDWRATNKLTLNIGLRYDVDTPRTERYNRLSYWDPDAPSPLRGQVASSAICPNCGNLRGAMMFVGPNGKYGRHQTPTDLNNWGPRFGFAYHAFEKTVFRGAYGILYSPSALQASGTSGSGGVQGFQSSTSISTTFDNGKTFAASLSNPFPGGFNLPQGSKVGPYSGALTEVGNSIGDSFFIDNANPIVQQWNVNIQQQVKGDWVLEAGYLGSKGNHLIDGESSMTYNQLPASFLALGSGLNAQVANPFYGLITTPNSPYAQPTIQQRFLLSAYPQYQGVNAFRKPQANSIYHGLTLSAEKRFSMGLSALVSFTGSKLLDDASQVVTFLGAAGTKQDFYCRKCEKSISAQDVSKRLVISANYDLPFGHGRSYLSGMARPLDAVLGGWQMNGIATFSNGTPLSISNGGNNTNIGSPGQRPNNNGKSAAKSGPIADRLNAYFDTSVFSQAPIYTFGNVGRFLPDVRIPGIHNLDFSLFKNFRVTERTTVQFRAESFNITNSPQWAAPNNNVTAVGTFGTITNTANSPRNVQLALKLDF
ncbi:MAG: TonB-dependent receptor [Acidobacteriota bacterium]|nr:TonB-dependent receptor [Acidobacteriota bacterium]